ncbi:biliverdin-producing heme oxygenase [Variovorax dokdonensis]|uniref:Biliverdin-producing heme oxygenase n=1 Tax=Variovorax dokdonensis TaxID=344883 RepID=A0ABT7NDI0_9BURK|nr:biliverdin-producing heme oxygenase [Variovorax dokdonensis]MDM0046007.1 biliverdin-producing heme oxygenase [Variovorax dokdonensis]
MPAIPTHFPTDPRDSLRRATAALHDRVDACMPLARPTVTLADYQEHLTLLRAWVDALRLRRPSLSRRLAQEADVLDADLELCLQWLGEATPAPALSHGGEASLTVEPITADADFDWGIAYVLEGSRLGGQVLYRRLSDALAPHPLNYLRGAGADTGAHWKAFLAELTAALPTAPRIQTACDGAVMAFDLLLQCHAERESLAEAVR